MGPKFDRADSKTIVLPPETLLLGASPPAPPRRRRHHQLPLHPLPRRDRRVEPRAHRILPTKGIERMMIPRRSWSRLRRWKHLLEQMHQIAHLEEQCSRAGGPAVSWVCIGACACSASMHLKVTFGNELPQTRVLRFKLASRSSRKTRHRLLRLAIAVANCAACRW